MATLATCGQIYRRLITANVRLAAPEADDTAAIPSFIRKTWTDAKPDVPKGLVQKVRAAEQGRTTPYEAQALWEARK